MGEVTHYFVAAEWTRKLSSPLGPTHPKGEGRRVLISSLPTPSFHFVDASESSAPHWVCSHELGRLEYSYLHLIPS